ncbi:MAG: cation:proton antiporter [Prevotella histicola]|jgi:putative Na+/H+ antiporter|uniref:cation:proton antiporter n=1 Tax=Prevotella histicola TaxID=470565 RepID=UPI001C5D7BAB|nr:cation:proton antiporter [Prevotella histicola]MBF1394793.1 cation:proton antiporter [Prevotella histicola]MBF1425709.1 cation:proton antiporter [Prevotella histicola]MBW4756541.1 cation:proton antiporter [Prevotella histicola]MBW4876525.1 cation:proton antiporter [Prevotella histicola]
MFNLSQYFPITDPTLIFFVVLLMILLSPIIMGRLRIPHIIGMVLAGVIVGKYGLNILERDASFELFGRVGLYYIMFLAGLEMDMEGLKKNRTRVIVFGLLTFLVPFAMTYFMGVSLLSYTPLAALLLSAIMASNTLIAYPIVGRYGLTRHTSSTLSVGSSMMALFMALIVMASIVNSFQGGAGIGFWVLFVVKFFVYSIGLILVIPRLTRWFLRRYSDAVMQFIFILAVVFLSAALSDAVGLEGIFGAFLSGLILNRFIPRVSPLMNRIEFTGNALFIPYFLIGVGMLINVRLLFQGTHILWVVFCLVLFGTLGKAVAAYLAAGVFRMPRLAGHMMFGLTSAHAAGAIAMVMVGRRLEISPGVYLFGDEVLNGIVIMILFTCVISTVVTEWAAQRLRLKEKKEPELVKTVNDEKILIPVKYPEYADNLVSMATMMRNPKLKRELVALNVVYDDVNMRHNQAEGQRLLEHLQHLASASDVPMTTQVRIAANIANGIKHAFKEFQASEILMGLHFHHNISKGFWGEFTRSLYNGLSRQIIITRIMQPLNTVRRIQVIVPSRAEFEPGFYRWLERLARMTENLECRIIFHGRKDTLQLINEYIHNNFASVRAEYVPMKHWNELPDLATKVSKDHLFVIVTARKGTISYKSAMERLPDEVNRYFKGKTLMIIFPDQYGNEMDDMTFAQPQHTEERSAYEAVREWIHNKV